MNIHQYFKRYYINLQNLSSDHEIPNPAYLAWVMTEDEHLQIVGKRRYKDYNCFRVVKSVHNKRILRNRKV